MHPVVDLETQELVGLRLVRAWGQAIWFAPNLVKNMILQKMCEFHLRPLRKITWDPACGVGLIPMKQTNCRTPTVYLWLLSMLDIANLDLSRHPALWQQALALLLGLSKEGTMAPALVPVLLSPLCCPFLIQDAGLCSSWSDRCLSPDLSRVWNSAWPPGSSSVLGLINGDPNLPIPDMGLPHRPPQGWQMVGRMVEQVKCEWMSPVLYLSHPLINTVITTVDVDFQRMWFTSWVHASFPAMLTFEVFIPGLGSISIKKAIQEDGKENKPL